MAEEEKPKNKKRLAIIGGAVAVVVIGIIIGTLMMVRPWEPVDLTISEEEMKELCQVESLEAIKKALVGEYFEPFSDRVEAQYEVWPRNSKYETPAFVYSWAGEDTENDAPIVFSCVASKNDKMKTEILLLSALWPRTEDKAIVILGNPVNAISTKGEDGSVAPSEDWMIKTCQKKYKPEIDEKMSKYNDTYEFINTKDYPRGYEVGKYESRWGSPLAALAWHAVVNNKELVTFYCLAAKNGSGEDELLYLSYTETLLGTTVVYGNLRSAYSENSWEKARADAAAAELAE